MKISVVMATYNGAEFIFDQLESLRNQKRSPDEVIIVDDASTDGTIRIMEEYIAAHRLENWSIHKNRQNIGWKRNFVRGFRMASGEFIFPCDQDDIWRSDKLSVMSEIMDRHKEIQVLVGGADYLFMEDCERKTFRYRVSQFLDSRKKRKHGFNTMELRKKEFDYSFKKIEQGCRMCIRKSFWEEVEKYWFPELAHDSLFSFYGKLKGGYYILDYDVIDYRYHVGSASVPNGRDRANRLKELQTDLLEITSLQENSKEMDVSHREMRILEQAVIWNGKRLGLVRDRKFGCGIRLLGYMRFYPQQRRYVTDWLYAIRGR